MSTMTKRLVLLAVVCGIAFWPWLILGLPLALIFTPCQWIGYSLGCSSKLPAILLAIADFIGSYFFCVVLVYIIILHIFKTASKRVG